MVSKWLNRSEHYIRAVSNILLCLEHLTTPKNVGVRVSVVDIVTDLRKNYVLLYRPTDKNSH